MRGRTPERVVVVGRDISVGSRLIARSVSEFASRFHIAEFIGAFLPEIIEPTANINFALPARILDDSNSKLIHPAVVLMKLSDKASVTLSDGETCKMSLCTSFSSRQSLNI
jgi:hypothetical protein